MESRNPLLEELVIHINQTTQNPEKEYFRTVLCYFFGKLAASMRVTIQTKDRGNIPVNLYTVALAPSGYGKGHSINIIEELLQGFREEFEANTIPKVATKHIASLAAFRAARDGIDEEEVLQKIQQEYARGGVIPFTFDSGTVPAIKQLRHTLLMGKIGSINYQVDEIASNLMGSTELLNVFLELYDQGQIKGKLIKNTEASIRSEEIIGKTPSNMLLFGTPSKLFDGATIEELFNEFLEIGYARRSLFAFGSVNDQPSLKTAKEVYEELVALKLSNSETRWINYFKQLALAENYGKVIQLPDDAGIRLTEYKLHCQDLARNLHENDNIGKAELSHRYFKTLKLAGALAFVNLQPTISMEILNCSIQIVEDSGRAFNKMRTRDKPYIRLAKYLSTMTAVTHADLTEALPFYKQSTTARNEMMTLAVAWGYKQNIIITREFIDDVELFSGSTLAETDTDNLICSYSKDLAHGYIAETAPITKLALLASTPDIHWTNHHFSAMHRSEANVIQGFNLLVIDVDGGTQAADAHKLLGDYAHLIYLTKRSTPEANRFRLIMPMSHTLHMDSDNYRDFIANVLNWLPFKVDEAANQRSRKWLSNPQGEIFTNIDDKPLLDITPFIPRTRRSEVRNKSVTNMDNLERWFFKEADKIGRNNVLLRYGLALKDKGFNLEDIKKLIEAFNKKLTHSLTKSELETTVLTTLTKRIEQSG